MCFKVPSSEMILFICQDGNISVHVKNLQPNPRAPAFEPFLCEFLVGGFNPINTNMNQTWQSSRDEHQIFLSSS